MKSTATISSQHTKNSERLDYVKSRMQGWPDWKKNAVAYQADFRCNTVKTDKNK